MLEHPLLPIAVRQFGEGAIDAGREGGISVIIDNYRASNTILALMEAGAIITPVETIEEALSYEGYIKVGEKGGVKHSDFDFDNSPYIISQNASIFKGKNVVIRTTNGTRGIVNATGSEEVLVGAFRNVDAIVDYLYDFAKQEVPISIVAMGSLDVSRIEDRYGAKMIFFRLLEKLDGDEYSKDMISSDENPWNRDWKQDIIDDRGLADEDRDDRLYALQLNKTDVIPVYNFDEKILERLDKKLKHTLA